MDGDRFIWHDEGIGTSTNGSTIHCVSFDRRDFLHRIGDSDLEGNSLTWIGIGIR